MKKIALFLALGILALSLMAGCGAAAESAPAVSEETASAAEESVPAPETPAPEEVPQEETVQEAPPEEPSVVEPAEEPAEVSAEEPAEEPMDAPAEADPETFFQDYLTEPSTSEVYAEVADKFELREYYDEESGLTIPYNFFAPEDTSEPLPMLMFIGDATCTGSNTDYSLSQGYGGIVWALDSEQAKRPCYIIVPVFPEIIIEDNVNPPYISPYMDAIPRMVEAVAAENNVDTNRLYTTGQSMGCMTSLYLAANHPDLFAAELFVSGQWQMDELQGLETQTFFYVAAGGDMKASGGQADVMADLDGKGLSYSASYDWDANLDDAGMEETLRAEIAEGSAMNFGQFAAGTVIEANNRGIEHMSSFDCAYKLDALRAWLFAQSK